MEKYKKIYEIIKEKEQKTFYCPAYYKEKTGVECHSFEAAILHHFINSKNCHFNDGYEIEDFDTKDFSFCKIKKGEKEIIFKGTDHDDLDKEIVLYCLSMLDLNTKFKFLSKNYKGINIFLTKKELVNYMKNIGKKQ